MQFLGIGPVCAIAFAPALSVNTSLTSLNLERNGLGWSGGSAIGEALCTNATLTSLNMSLNDIGPEGGAAVAKAVKSQTCALVELTMLRCGLGPDGGRALGEALEVNTTIRTLDITQNDLGVAGGLAFGRALGSNTTLNRLNMRFNRIGFGLERASGFAKALQSNTTLTWLDMAQNELGAIGGQAFGEAMRANTGLKTLIMQRNELGEDGGAALGDALSANGCLTSLDASSNDLGANGITTFGDALRANATLLHLDVQNNGIGADGGVRLANGLRENTSLCELHVDRNGISAAGGEAIAAAVAVHPSLTKLCASRNAMAHSGGMALATALASCPALTWLNLRENDISDEAGRTLCEAVASASSAALTFVDLSDNLVETVPIACQLLLAQKAAQLQLDLSGNPLASPPLGRRADVDTLREYLELLLSEPAAVSRMRLMVVGFGGVGKTTFCGAATRGASELANYHQSLTHCTKWDASMIASWARGLRSQHDWAPAAADVLEAHSVRGVDLESLLPAASFNDPSSRHYGSWRYWLTFLRALGERRTHSLLLAVSQIDRVAEADAPAATAASCQEFEALQAAHGGGLGDAPLTLDYRPEAIHDGLATVRQRLAAASDAVARDWWVPASYEKLAELVRRVGRDKASARELPILTQSELLAALEADGTEGLRRMCGDPLLLQRGVEYLEAVGDVMIDGRLDCLLLDPVGWFASFLAHFIRDDGNPPAEVVRGVVDLSDVVSALRNDYAAPETQVPEVMALVCKLELCIELSGITHSSSDDERYLFPCLLPAATPSELAEHWPVYREPQQQSRSSTERSGSSSKSTTATTAVAQGPMRIRGHRFCATQGFLPPGLFPTLVARLARLPDGTLSPTRLWSHAAVLQIRGTVRVLLRVDVETARLDVVAAGPTDERFFVGAAKGQASIVVWLAHLIRQFLRAYAQIDFEESWLCPNPECHGLRAPDAAAASSAAAEEAAEAAGVPGTFGAYVGSEFELKPRKAKPGHVCEQEGCWHFLGKGHQLEPMQLQHAAPQCARCGEEPHFPLRAGGGFGWASKEEAEQMRRGLSLAQPALGFGVAGASSTSASPSEKKNPPRASQRATRQATRGRD